MAGFELQEVPAPPVDSPAGLIPPDGSWSPLEYWIRQKLQGGAIANIDEYEDESGRLPAADPRKPEDWQDGRRRLSPRFLEDLLLREPYRSGLHRKGMHIEGAWFEEAIDLSIADLVRALWLCRCRFEKAVDLQDLRTPAAVSLDSSAFAARLDLQGACIDAHLFMRFGAEFNDVVLLGAKVGGRIDVRGAKVNGTLNMDAADIGGSLLMQSLSEQRAEFNKVVLRGAKVGGQVSLIGTKVSGTLDMDVADIGERLLMSSDRQTSEHQAEFNDVLMGGAKVGGVVLIAAKLAGTLDMDSADIAQHLLMRSDRSKSEHRAWFNKVVLRGAKVGGQVSLIGATVAGALDMDGADIGDSLLMRSDRSVSEHRAEFDGGVSLAFAEIGRSLDLRGAVLSSFDLSGTRIGGQLTLASGSWSPQWWKGRGKLVLRNASVDTIQDIDEDGVWPTVLDFDGFTYRRLGGLGSGAEVGVAERGSRWFIDWLARGKPYTPGPYQQCAHVLREMGHSEMATDILYAGRERERHEIWAPRPDKLGHGPRARFNRSLHWFKTMLAGRHASPWSEETRRSLRWFGLLLLALVVGYGYGYRLLWRPLAWVVALVAAGTAVLQLTGVPEELAGSDAAVVAYSFDTLLPIVELEKSFADIVLHGFAKYYFYFQKLMGWVLASFLIAGVSGITK